eukprot:TRINITY_DN924_c0_g1_i4.p1 TRINITY_DN924_c0_g1~~TRINITY_DN924_c0_g1_i4.p1  ORF type:complete len:934 (+),score=228.69 TRINITY_DN924_c0_g1_i4:734-3535(+)
MTTAILDSKKALEESIAKMFRENAPESIDHKKIAQDRADIQSRIRELTKICLEKFTNPSYLLKFAQDMNSRKEMEIVLEVTYKCLERIKDINNQRRERLPVQLSFDELEKERDEYVKQKKDFPNEEKLKKVKAKLDSFPIWPHFANIYSKHQYDQTVLSAIKVAMNAVMDNRDDLEKDIQQQYYKDRTTVNEKQVKIDREKAESYINQVIKAALENIQNPNYVLELAKEASRKKDTRVVLELAHKCYSSVFELEELRESKDKLVQAIKILEEEKESLGRKKKELPKNLSHELTELQDQLKAKEIPEFLSSADNHVSIIDSMAELTISSVFSQKNDLSKKLTDDSELPLERRNFLSNMIKDNISRTIKMILKYVENPSLLLNLTSDTRRRKEWECSLKIGSNCLDKLNRLKKVRLERKEPNEKRKALIKEREELEKKRGHLSSSKKQQWRQLELECRLFELTPSYYNSSVNYDNLCYDVTVEMIQTCLDKKEEFFNKSTSNDELTDEAKAEKKKEFEKEVAEVVAIGLQRIESTENYIRLARALSEKKEYGHAITVGSKCEKIIDEKAKELEERDKLRKQFEDLEAKHLQALVKKADETNDSSMPEDDDTAEKLEKVRKTIEDLPPLDYNYEKLNNQMVEISDLMIQAAKIEEDENVFKEQIILAFKADTTTARWDAVKNMTVEEDWDKIKKELVVYVMKRDDNPTDKIELLLKDGLYEQCISIFPPPSGAPGELDLLYNLYDGVERNKPSYLQHLVPTITRYIKRYFQEHKYESLSKILDRVQRRFPSVITQIYSQATDMVLLNIMPSQYAPFVQCLKDLKRRLAEIGRMEDWDDFYKGFRHKHKGKKKLIQMVSLIGDSQWDLKQMINAPKRKRVKTEDQNSNSVKQEPKIKVPRARPVKAARILKPKPIKVARILKPKPIKVARRARRGRR